MADSYYDAVVLAGGSARRLDGVDKPALPLGGVGGMTLLDRVVAACTEARSVVCVGPERPTGRPVHWTREDPPGSGPVAALAAGLALTRAPYVAVLAADLPFLTADVVHTLWTNAADHDGAVLTDEQGKDQWLAACYRRSALTAAIARYESVAGLSLKRLLAGFDLTRVPDTEGSAFDCDTWDDVAHVRGLVDGSGGDHRPPRTESEH
jgi:molybdopterin-guanine dinucleotide biosynthesis protein A